MNFIQKNDDLWAITNIRNEINLSCNNGSLKGSSIWIRDNSSHNSKYWEIRLNGDEELIQSKLYEVLLKNCDELKHYMHCPGHTKERYTFLIKNTTDNNFKKFQTCIDTIDQFGKLGQDNINKIYRFIVKIR
jgi:hypothetical protein